jgi:hypothetical protein
MTDHRWTSETWGGCRKNAMAIRHFISFVQALQKRGGDGIPTG